MLHVSYSVIYIILFIIDLHYFFFSTIMRKIYLPTEITISVSLNLCFPFKIFFHFINLLFVLFCLFVYFGSPSKKRSVIASLVHYFMSPIQRIERRSTYNRAQSPWKLLFVTFPLRRLGLDWNKKKSRYVYPFNQNVPKFFAIKKK